MPYVDENGEELSDREAGQFEGRTEVLDGLVWSLGDHVKEGSLTLTAAVAIWAEAAEVTKEVAASVLCECWVEVMALRWSDMGDTTTE